MDTSSTPGNPALLAFDSFKQRWVQKLSSVSETTFPLWDLGRFDFSNLPPYIAISYVWGQDTVRSMIPCETEGYLAVTDAVSTVLDTILSSGETITIWVDSVCIDQKNGQEKNHQVTVMREIYSSAGQVAVMVGASSEESDLAMDLMGSLSERFLDLEKRGQHLDPYDADITSENSPLAYKRWPALGRFLSHPYFTRTWIVQEIALAHDPVVICGNHAIAWARFATMIGSLSRFVVQFRAFRLFRDMPEFCNGDEEEALLRGISNICSIAAITNSPTPEGLGGLQEILIGMRAMQATDSRDMVYGLLGLIGPQDLPQIIPDYNATVRHVYSDVARIILCQHGSPLLLHFAGTGMSRKVEDLPSWAVDWTSSQRPSFGAALHRGLAGLYNATLDTAVSISQGIGNDRIAVRGMIIDHVAEIGKVVRNDWPIGVFNPGTAVFVMWQNSGLWLDEASRLASNSQATVCRYTGSNLEAPSSSKRASLGQAFWRTVIANRCRNAASAGPHGLHPRPDIADAACMYFESEARDPTTPGLAQVPRYPTDQFDQVKLFERAFKEATLDRKFFLTGRGYMGLCDPGASCGDAVALLSGFTTPFILRPVHDRDSSSEDATTVYELIGEVYPHGLMDVEGLKMGNMIELELM